MLTKCLLNQGPYQIDATGEPLDRLIVCFSDVVQLASNHRDVFEALLTAYADIGDALPRFDRYEKAFNDNPEFQNVLASVYSSILDFHQRAYKFFRRRGMASEPTILTIANCYIAWHLLFLSVWKDFGSRFENIISSLKKQRDFLDKEAQSFDIIEGKESRLKVQDDIEQRQRRDEELLEQNERTTRIAQLQHSVVSICSQRSISKGRLMNHSKFTQS